MLYDCATGTIWIGTFSHKKSNVPKMYIIANKNYLVKYAPKITILKPYIFY